MSSNADPDKHYAFYMEKLLNYHNKRAEKVYAFDKSFHERHEKALEYIDWCGFQQQKQIQKVEEQKQRQLENDNKRWENFKQALMSLTSQFPGLEARVATGKIFHLPNTQQKIFFQQLYSIYFSANESEISLIFIQKLIETVRKFELMIEGENKFVELQTICKNKIHELQTFLESTPIEASKSHQTLLSYSNDPLLRRLSSSDDNTKNLLEKVNALLNQKKVQPPQQSISQSSQPLAAAELTILPHCIVSAKERIQWLAGLADLTQSVALPLDVAALLNETVHSLQLNSLREENGLERALSLGVNLLQRAATTGDSQPDPKVLLKIILTLLEDGIVGATAAAEQDAEEDWLLLSTAGCCVLQQSPLSAATRKQALQIFRSILDKANPLCYPDLQGLLRDQQQGSLKYLGLLAAVSGRWEVDGKPEPAWAWSWLVAAGEQLNILLNDPNKSKRNKNKCQTAYRCVRLVLRLSGHNLFLRYQNEFHRLLQTYSSLLANTKQGTEADEEGIKLAALLSEGLKRSWLPPRFHVQLPPYVYDTMRAVGDVEECAINAAQEDKNRQSAFMGQVRALKIDRLRAVFNKLSAAPESHSQAVQQLLSLIVQTQEQAALQQHMPLLQYTLFQISNTALNDCQEEFFLETDESHPTKLARLVCGLCHALGRSSSGGGRLLRETIRGHFFRECPLVVPREAGNLTGDQFMNAMNFKQKKLRASDGSLSMCWEDKTHWLQRMSKILTTFAVIVIQPEQTPFTLKDGWTWLSRIANLTAPYIYSNSSQATNKTSGSNNSSSGSGSSPPFFIATALEVFLRVTAPAMHREFKGEFMRLLRCIREQILPNCSKDMPKRDALSEFLIRFIDSDGLDFMSLFQKAQ
eukprot:gene27147-35871_t